MEKENYSGIDFFRFIAALLIIAIHTSPLESFGEVGDFILTRVTARIAVPFFFMTSGFFVISRFADHDNKFKRFLTRTAVIYAVASVLYLPLNIYKGYFATEYFLPNLIKDIVFDGTFYHLWYLPAALLGGALAWLLLRHGNEKKALIVTAALYLIGLFGDSYYGLTESIPAVSNAYELVFQITDFTRNGLFFAPVFFVLGGIIADKKQRLSLVGSIIGTVLCFVLMLGEAMALRGFGYQRHDSMYLFLVPLVWFLFNLLLNIKSKKSLKAVRSIPLIMYIIHHAVIVAVRYCAKALKLEGLLLKNNLVHFAAVSVISIVASLAFSAVYVLIKKKTAKPMHDCRTDRAWIETNGKALLHNVDALQSAMPSGCRLMAVVKAEAYGHRAASTAILLERNGVEAFATATVDEGIELRKSGIRGEILVLGYTDVRRAAELKKYKLTQTVIDRDYAKRLNDIGIYVKVHIGIDTGMHRLGIDSEDISGIKELFGYKKLDIQGIFTHLCRSEALEAADIEFTGLQIKRFYALTSSLKAAGISVPKVHIQSSYGLLNYPELKCDYVRVGIALYGVYGLPDDKTKLTLELKPVLSLKARVALIREVKAGEGIGYNGSYKVERDSVIAILPIGYADGLPRSLSNGKTSVKINDRLAPVVGLICMDQLTVDITDIKDSVSVGDTAVLLDEDINIPGVAMASGSISNELLSRIGKRLPLVER